jgi:hypothetical protein
MRRPGTADRALASGTNGGQNHGRCTLDEIQRLRQRVTVAVVQMQVIATGFSGVEPNCFADDEGNGFRIEFARVT